MISVSFCLSSLLCTPHCPITFWNSSLLPQDDLVLRRLAMWLSKHLACATSDMLPERLKKCACLTPLFISYSCCLVVCALDKRSSNALRAHVASCTVPCLWFLLIDIVAYAVHIPLQPSSIHVQPPFKRFTKSHTSIFSKFGCNVHREYLLASQWRFSES